MTTTFISSTLVNATKLHLAGQDVRAVLSEYRMRMDVLDAFLKDADPAHYYAYYFGVALEDGGLARDGVGSFNFLYQPNDIVAAEINGQTYAFVASWGNDAINVSGAPRNRQARVAFP